MSNKRSAVPTDALGDSAYLSRSENRVQILDAIANGPHTRRELSEVTGVSRATLSRIMNELEERGWALRTTDGDYEATPTGKHVSAQFVPFVESLEAINRLGEAVDWLPTDELSIGLHHFSDATVKRPEHGDPMEIIDLFTRLIRDATEFRVLTQFAPPSEFAKSMCDGLVTGRLRGTYVLTGDLIEYLGEHPDRRARWHACLEAGATVSHYEGHIPCNLWVIDGTVFIKKSGPKSIQSAYGVPIISENDAVREWAIDLIETYRAEADPVGVDVFGGGSFSSQGESTG